MWSNKHFESIIVKNKSCNVHVTKAWYNKRCNVYPRLVCVISIIGSVDRNGRIHFHYVPIHA